MTVIWLADNLFLHPGTIPVKIVWLESSTISLIYDPGSQQSVLKTENEEKWIWFWRTSIQIKKLWQSQNIHPICSGLFVTSAAAVAGSFHLTRLELLWVNKRNLFLASLISILLAFFTPVLRWMRLFSGSPLCSSKTQLLLHPSKYPCTFVFCPPHQFSLSLFYI